MATFDLSRFVAAQAGPYVDALAELRAGAKRSHWMWFVFPQIAGLGTSPMAQRYALAGPDEARAYLGHALLGPRLVECTRAVLAVEGRTLHEIFGSPDDLKFRSSMTLFEIAAGPGSDFSVALDRLCGGERDGATLERARAAGGGA
jgi:uncharacterized protein (DUF1810 family)